MEEHQLAKTIWLLGSRETKNPCGLKGKEKSTMVQDRRCQNYQRRRREYWQMENWDSTWNQQARMQWRQVGNTSNKVWRTKWMYDRMTAAAAASSTAWCAASATNDEVINYDCHGMWGVFFHLQYRGMIVSNLKRITSSNKGWIRGGVWGIILHNPWLTHHSHLFSTFSFHSLLPFSAPIICAITMTALMHLPRSNHTEKEHLLYTCELDIMKCLSGVASVSSWKTHDAFRVSKDRKLSPWVHVLQWLNLCWICSAGRARVLARFSTRNICWNPRQPGGCQLLECTSLVLRSSQGQQLGIGCFSMMRDIGEML